MKTKISKIWGVGLTLVLATTMLLFPMPASAGTLSWGSEDLPDELELDTDVLDIAVSADGGVIYATTVGLPLDGTFTLAALGSELVTVTGVDPPITPESDDDTWVKTGTVTGNFTGTTTDLLGSFTADITLATDFSGGSQAVTDRMIISGTITDTSLTFSGTIEGISENSFTFDQTLTITGGTFNVAVDGVVSGSLIGDGFESIIISGSLVGSIFRSTNGGESWSTLSNPTDATVPQLVAVAPDDENYIAIVADDKEVYVSDDAGANWDPLVTTALVLGLDVINDIAISAAKGGYHYVAVAGVDDSLGVPVGEVWYYKVGGVGSVWNEASAEEGFDDGTELDNPEEFAGAVAFSPNFASDEVMVAITADDNAVLFQIFSFDQGKWNDAAGFGDYPVDLTQDTGFELESLDSASIALSPDYLGSDDSMRLAFVGLALTGGTTVDETTGIQRIEDDSSDVLKDDVLIHSIAYDGTNLVAGRYDSNIVYRCADPLASSPSVSGSASLKSPGLNTDVYELLVVAFAGNKVVAGTSGDESAFAVSGDDGKTFNDISLIDTALTNLSDVAVSPDGSKVYLVTDDGNDLSLWRYASAWERVLTVDGKKDFIVRLAPDDDEVLYVAEKGSTKIYYSAKGGDVKWHTRISTEDIGDLAVEGDGSVVYVATGGYVSKSTNGGFTWGSKKSSKLSDISMLTSLGEDLLLAGSTDGKAAYSTDGNSSWSKLSGGMPSEAVQVIASGLEDGDFVYAVTNEATEVDDDFIYRWELDEDDEWDGIGTAAVAGFQCSGIALKDGVLYAVAYDTEDSKLYRSLNPTSDDPSWNTADSAKELFTVTPSALRVSVSDTTTKLWAIDSLGALFSYKDTLAAVAPTLLGPEDGFLNKMNPISGAAFDVNFSWERPSKKVTAYDFQIALDSAFNEMALDQVLLKDSSKVGILAGPTGSEVGVGKFQIEFMPDTTYYWRVRVDAYTSTTDPIKDYGPVRSPWSEVRSFEIEEAPVPEPVTVAPTPEITIAVPPAPAITIQPPEIIMPTPEIVLPAPQVTLPPTPAPVAPIPGWALYLIIIIGAVLVVALIVLILRTRRPV